MADIRPFAAWRYSPQLSNKLASLLTPPYDVISPALREELYARHPKNLVRIDFGREEREDNASVNKYSRAEKLWKEWKSEGTLVQDANPSIYVYEQEFEATGRRRKRRRGFFCAVKLEDFNGGGIRAHEHTFAGPKADRLNLMRATASNLSPIFCIYDDPACRADKIIAQTIEGKTAIATTVDGIVQRLWPIDDPATVDSIRTAMKPQKLVIADGHHRYETSLNYRDEQRKKTGRNGGDEPFDYTLMFLANTHDEGLEILPTHRVLSRRLCAKFEPTRALQDLAKHFEIEEFHETLSDTSDKIVRLRQKLEEAGRTNISYALILPEYQPHILTLKQASDPDALIADPALSKEVKRLDVTLLHRYVVPRVWLGNASAKIDDNDIAYVKEAVDVVRMVTSGEHGAGFLLNPTRVEQVIQIAGSGNRMPHKSTFFYPKLITGLVMRGLNDEHGN